MTPVRFVPLLVLGDGDDRDVIDTWVSIKIGRLIREAGPPLSAQEVIDICRGRVARQPDASGTP